MFELSKILTPLLDPRTCLFIVLLAGALLLWTPARRLGRLLVSLAVVVALIFLALPIGPTLLHRLEHRFPRLSEPPPRVDGIIALGGDFSVTLAEEYGPGSAFSPRLAALADLGRRYPDARLVFSGGSGRLSGGTLEADLAPTILAALGLDPARVTYEGRSRNTRENAAFSKALVDPQPGERWLLVTSAFHMPRSVGAFRAAGWPVTAYPVEFQAVSGAPIFSMDGGLHNFSLAVRETIGLTYYWLRGWTPNLLPAP